MKRVGVGVFVFGKYEGRIQFFYQNVGTNRTGAICIFLKDVKGLHVFCEASMKLRIEILDLVLLINCWTQWPRGLRRGSAPLTC